MKDNSVPVAMVLLYQQGCFLMQLRDDKPFILYPGQWGLFGGHLEAEENPKRGVIREVKEEIEYELLDPQYFRCYSDAEAQRHIFYAPLTADPLELAQNEGQDLDLVSIEAIEKGKNYSDKIKETRTLGSIHRQILLDFVSFAENRQIDLR